MKSLKIEMPILLITILGSLVFLIVGAWFAHSEAVTRDLLMMHLIANPGSEKIINEISQTVGGSAHATFMFVMASITFIAGIYLSLYRSKGSIMDEDRAILPLNSASGATAASNHN